MKIKRRAQLKKESKNRHVGEILEEKAEIARKEQR